jgi:hypothetical protein
MHVGFAWKLDLDCEESKAKEEDKALNVKVESYHRLGGSSSSSKLPRISLLVPPAALAAPWLVLSNRSGRG